MPEISPFIVRGAVYSLVPSLPVAKERKRQTTSRLTFYASAGSLVCLGAALLWCCSLQLVVYPFHSWVFAEGIQGRSDVSFFDYVKSATVGENRHSSRSNSTTTEVLGRISIGRLGISEVVRGGRSIAGKSGALQLGFTSRPGMRGNCVLVTQGGRWDNLHAVRPGDVVTIQSSLGTSTEYRVAAAAIVRSSDLSILAANGGSLVLAAGRTQARSRLLTLISPLPFAPDGYAPKRLVVEAVLVEPGPAPVASPEPASGDESTSGPRATPTMLRSQQHRLARSRRHLAVRLRGVSARKRSLWRRLLHRD